MIEYIFIAKKVSVLSMRVNGAADKPCGRRLSTLPQKLSPNDT